MPRTAGVNVTNYKDTMLLEMKGKPKNRLFQVRPLYTMTQAPGFTMVDSQRMSFGDHTIQISLAMYATIGQMRIDEVPFERLVLRLKDP